MEIRKVRQVGGVLSAAALLLFPPFMGTSAAVQWLIAIGRRLERCLALTAVLAVVLNSFPGQALAQGPKMEVL